jgi:nucleoside-diphosphate-sugar epimerase
MKVLFTGASSFTGFWFVRELARAGHDVTATFRRGVDEYPDEPRRTRVRELATVCRPVVGAAFGDDKFLELVRGTAWDVVCHHAAEVTNYKSPDFDAVGATASNTRAAAKVMELMKQAGCHRLVVTGSVFENDEGAGSEGLAAFSAYGLSKALAWQTLRYYAGRAGLSVGKFVIPNPFGPFEEPRFTAYLMKNWLAGKPAGVNTPEYVRDNIHVSLLARCYARFVAGLGTAPGIARLNPSGYVESQGAFTQRFAAEMRARLHLACEVTLARQTDFSEPRTRINTDPARPLVPDWDEAKAWDDVAAYYAGSHR